jgi:hypothetical protein
MFLKSEITTEIDRLKSATMTEIDKLKLSIANQSDSAGRDLAAIADSIVEALTVWLDRSDDIIKRRNDLDVEDELIKDGLKSMLLDINKALNVASRNMSGVPSSLPKITADILEINPKKQAAE